MAIFEVTHGHTDTRTHGRMDGRTDGQTKTTHLSTTTEIFFLCEGEGGKLYKPYEISTSSLREG